VTLRQDLDRRVRSLAEISKILGSMRSLAYLEARKLTRFLSSQRRVVEHIEQAAGDFLQAFPDFGRSPAQAISVVVVIGSERGFCGDFNERLTRYLEDRAGRSRLISVGHKLNLAMQGNARLEAELDGPSVAEEVQAVLLNVTAQVSRLSREHGAVELTAVYHDVETDTVRSVSVLPPFRERKPVAAHGCPPRLNLAPERFFTDLVDQYLLAALNGMFYTSLMAEQQNRIRHLEAAMKRLEEQATEISLRRNTLRQEEITEEIEVILLGVAGRQGM
jgi:F-type H+-transporting ATPase subunit gamma